MDRRVLTYTGRYIDVFDLKPEDICLADIAHSLATKTRFNGSAKVPYSIAQHCVLATAHCKPPLLPTVALLHDAEEAYLVDIPKPWKGERNWHEIDEYGRILRDKIWGKCIDNFDFARADYKWIDHQLLLLECKTLLTNWQTLDFMREEPELNILIDPWPWDKAEWEFLDMAKWLGLKD